MSDQCVRYTGGTVEQDRGRTTDHFHVFSDWLRQHAILSSLIILLCAFSIRLFFTLQADPKDLTFPDSPSYLRPALSLMESGSFLHLRKEGPDLNRTPGYPVFLAALMYVVGKDLRNLLIAQTIVVSFTVLILYWIARRILPPVMAITGAMLAALSPWSAATAGLLLSESFYLLILVLLFLFMYLVVERESNLFNVLLGGGVIGLLTSAAVLVRPLWPLVPIVAVILFLLCRDKRQRAWILVAVMLVCASTPLYVWKNRNLHEAQFDGLSTSSGVVAYRYWAARVKAHVKGTDGDRWAMLEAARMEESRWGLPVHAMNDEHWRQAKAVFREHPVLSLYTFTLNVSEALVHPDPSILRPARLNFYGDVWVLGGFWAALVVFAGIGLCCTPDKERDEGLIRREWLLALLGICLLLTMQAGFAFGQGSRYRVPLELIVPLLAGVGLVRVVSYLKRAQVSSL